VLNDIAAETVPAVAHDILDDADLANPGNVGTNFDAAIAAST